MAWESNSEKEMIIGKVILEISRKNDVHNNYETDYNNVDDAVSTLNAFIVKKIVNVFASTIIKICPPAAPSIPVNEIE